MKRKSGRAAIRPAKPAPGINPADAAGKLMAIQAAKKPARRTKKKS